MPPAVRVGLQIDHPEQVVVLLRDLHTPGGLAVHRYLDGPRRVGVLSLREGEQEGLEREDRRLGRAPVAERVLLPGQVVERPLGQRALSARLEQRLRSQCRRLQVRRFLPRRGWCLTLLLPVGCLGPLGHFRHEGLDGGVGPGRHAAEVGGEVGDDGQRVGVLLARQMRCNELLRLLDRLVPVAGRRERPPYIGRDPHDVRVVAVRRALVDEGGIGLEASVGLLLASEPVLRPLDQPRVDLVHATHIAELHQAVRRQDLVRRGLAEP